MSHETKSDRLAREAREYEKMHYPWIPEVIDSLEAEGHWAGLAGFESWLRDQNEELSETYDELSLDVKTALFTAFHNACDAAVERSKR